MNTDKKIFWITLFLVLSLAGTAFAKDINFEVTVDKKKVSLDSTVNLNLNFYGTQNISRPDLPDISGFDWRYLGPSTRMSIVNGRISSSITHMYILIPLEAGEFTIPPFSVYHEGKMYTSDPIPIEVTSSPISPPQVLQEETYEDKVEGLKDRIFLVMQVGKQEAYINEIIPVTIKLYIQKLAIRDIQYPEFARQGFSADKFNEPKQYQEVLGGIPYDVIEFNTDIFGMHPGELKLGPAELKCNLLLKKDPRKRFPSVFDDDFFGSDIFGDFFGRGYEKYPLNLKSADIPIRILALPKENVPGNFSGAIGNFQFSLESSPKEVKVGDPITLKMTITGDGNFRTIKLPTFDAKDDFKVYDPEVKQGEGVKIFEQVIIPQSDRVSKIPEVSFSFFDTKSGKYRTITKGPIPVKVNPLPRGEELKIFETPEGPKLVEKIEILGRDIIYIKDSPGRLRPEGVFLCKNRLFIAAQFITLLAIASFLIFQRRRERLKRDIPYARRLRAPRKAKKNLRRVRYLLDSKEPGRFFDTVFKTLQEYLGDKFHLPTAGITSNVAEELKARSINEKILDKLRECFTNCDTARYAPSSVTRDQMLGTLKLLEGLIDELEKMKT